MRTSFIILISIVSWVSFGQSEMDTIVIHDYRENAFIHGPGKGKVIDSAWYEKQKTPFTIMEKAISKILGAAILLLKTTKVKHDLKEHFWTISEMVCTLSTTKWVGRLSKVNISFNQLIS